MIKRLLLIFAALCGFVWLLSPVAVHAQGGAAVTASSATVSFPMQINFSMKASSSTTITDIRLRYSVDQESFADVVAEAYVAFTPATTVNAQYSLDMRKTALIDKNRLRGASNKPLSSGGIDNIDIW